MITAKLIWAFVFAYAEGFSHDAAQILYKNLFAGILLIIDDTGDFEYSGNIYIHHTSWNSLKKIRVVLMMMVYNCWHLSLKIVVLKFLCSILAGQY